MKNFLRNINYILFRILGVTAIIFILSSCASNKIETKGLTALPPPVYGNVQKTKGEQNNSSDTFSYQKDDFRTSDNFQNKAVTVEAKGIGQSEEKALNDALVKAQSKVNGAFLSSVSKLEKETNTVSSGIEKKYSSNKNFKKILNSSTSGFVDNYEIIKPWNRETRQIKIRANITKGEINSLSAMDVIKTRLGFPKFAILIKDENNPNKMDFAAMSSIMHKFRKHGFEFIPNTESAFFLNRLAKIPASILSYEIYKKTGARYIIIGNIRINSPKPTTTGVIVEASMTVEIIDGMKNDVLATFTDSQVGTGISKATAGKSAVKKLLDIAFDKNDIGNEIYNEWAKKLNRFKGLFEEELKNSN